MFDFNEELKKLPDRPGVYIMHDSSDEIIYVGKAVNLKNRVRQYFQNSKNKSPKVSAMVSHIAYFEYIVTDSEMEALLLECNLIKEHRPKYNVMLKDDKTYPYIKVTTNEEFPRIFITRKYVKDKNRYFGPITDATAAKETVELINKLFPIRKCKKKFPRDIGKERPCLNYHIGQCLAPCDNMVTKEEYAGIVDEVLAVLEGKYDYIIKYLEGLMYAASENMDFEKAAAYRDRISGIKKIMEKQKITNTGVGDSDVIAFSRAMDEALVQVFFIRGGKLSGREHFLINAPDYIDRSGIMTQFVKQFYSGTAYIPKELILEEELINDFDALLMKGCYHYTVNNDVEISIQVINTKIQAEKSFEQLCYEHNIAGAILMGLRTNDPYCELLAKSKYPCVTIDIEVPGPNVSCVMMDDIKAFDELTQYLIDKGHRKIVVVHGRKLAMVSMQRLVGAYQAMQRNGLELPHDNIIYTNFGREEARDGVKEYFRTHSPDSATAFLCMSDMLAIGTIEGLKELGYEVPKDYSVVGFDGLEVTNYTDPAITTIDQNIQQKGYEATRLLCDMIRGKRKAQRLVLPHTLTVRNSVRPL